jgi:hypothetical protein
LIRSIYLTERTLVAGYARSQGRAPVTFGPTDILCCRTLQGHTGKVNSIQIQFPDFKFLLKKFVEFYTS